MQSSRRKKVNDIDVLHIYMYIYNVYNNAPIVSYIEIMIMNILVS